ncbi:threonine aldolase family protein [Limibacillus halophilus]|uniref:L-threonine aldolase n=1 Tax=Limibacillus halophilus TaxID=1579333 RepID=A0A839SV04_9PROT|nr:low specificity L-threonine aldolase [Limibacillus halophilus]MBB3064773.1 threonine aldolase [Limibacillus halophilus]
MNQNFASDNTAGAAPEILEALAEAATGRAMPYGGDDWTARVERRLAEVFEADCAVFPVATGTAANTLGLSIITPPWGAIYCHEHAHIILDESSAPELFTGGARQIGLPGAVGKLDPETLARKLANSGQGDVHHVQPAVLALTQLTEWGTAYSPSEIAALTEVARHAGMRVQMDGARFANALVGLGCSPAEMTWKAGVDVLSFGATKNGCLAAEAVVVFDRGLAESLPFRRKRAAQLYSKMRFISAQLEAYLADDLWLRLAARANDTASLLADGLQALEGIELVAPVQGNEIFLRLSDAVAAGLAERGFIFYPWTFGGAGVYRLVTAFDSEVSEIEAFVAAARDLTGKRSQAS